MTTFLSSPVDLKGTWQLPSSAALFQSQIDFTRMQPAHGVSGVVILGLPAWHGGL
jgi:hypothetical protein